MRESYRLQKTVLHEKMVNKQMQLLVFFIYVGNELPDYPAVFGKTGAAIKRLTRIADENSTADS